jgi:hypothetical protein
MTSERIDRMNSVQTLKNTAHTSQETQRLCCKDQLINAVYLMTVFSENHVKYVNNPVCEK